MECRWVCGVKVGVWSVGGCVELRWVCGVKVGVWSVGGCVECPQFYWTPLPIHIFVSS